MWSKTRWILRWPNQKFYRILSDGLGHRSYANAIEQKLSAHKSAPIITSIGSVLMRSLSAHGRFARWSNVGSTGSLFGLYEVNDLRINAVVENAGAVAWRGEVVIRAAWRYVPALTHPTAVIKIGIRIFLICKHCARLSVMKVISDSNKARTVTVRPDNELTVTQAPWLAIHAIESLSWKKWTMNLLLNFLFPRTVKVDSKSWPHLF